MAKLADDATIYSYLDVKPEEDPNGIVLQIRDAIENLLELETNAVFGPSENLIQEQYDGTGNDVLYVNRPIGALTKIEFRFLPDVTQELYQNLDMFTYVTWNVGKRRIHSRLYPFPCGYDNVLVTYTAAANQPKLAITAVCDATAAVYRSMGSEDARSEQKGTFQHSLIRGLDEVKTWVKAVELFLNPQIG